MPSRTNVDLFLADPLATELSLPEFDPKQMRFAYRLQLAHGNDDEQVLEEVFRIFNIDHPRDYLKRSLSTGDVVTIDAKRSYRCNLAGWVALNPAVTRAWSETLREMLGKSGNCLRRRNRLRLSCRTRGCVVAETPECSRCFTDYDSPEFLHTGFLEHLARFRSSLGRRVVHKCENCGSRIWLASESQFCSDQCFRDWIPF